MRKAEEEGESPWKRTAVLGPTGAPAPVPVPAKEDPDINKPIDRVHADTIINFLIKLACQVSKHMQYIYFNCNYVQSITFTYIMKLDPTETSRLSVGPSSILDLSLTGVHVTLV